MAPVSKTCFVTIGATASFAKLIHAVLEPSLLDALQSQGYTELIIQYGQDGKPLFDEILASTNAEKVAPRLHISGFNIDPVGLGQHMRQAKGDDGVHSVEGVVISHAGSGTILDALRLSVPLIVVPNPDLLDNHQIELAEALASQEYVVHGHLERLGEALEKAEVLRKRMKAWPPPNAVAQRRGGGLRAVIDDEMGWKNEG